MIRFETLGVRLPIVGDYLIHWQGHDLGDGHVRVFAIDLVHIGDEARAASFCWLSGRVRSLIADSEASRLAWSSILGLLGICHVARGCRMRVQSSRTSMHCGSGAYGL